MVPALSSSDVWRIQTATWVLWQCLAIQGFFSTVGPSSSGAHSNETLAGVSLTIFRGHLERFETNTQTTLGLEASEALKKN